MGLTKQNVSILVVIFAVIIYAFPREFMRFWFQTVVVWENMILKSLIGQVCISQLPNYALVWLGFRRYFARECDPTGTKLIMPEYNFTDFGSQESLCPILDKLGTSTPWIVRGVQDVSHLKVREMMESARDRSINVINKTAWATFIKERVKKKCEHGYGCVFLRQERLFSTTIGEWLDFSEELKDQLFYVAFDANVADLVFDSMRIKSFCGHELDRTKIDAFITRKYTDVDTYPWHAEIFTELFGEYIMPDTPMHCAAESNHFFQLKGRKTWNLVDPTYSPELGMLHDNLVQNAVGTGAYHTGCIPHMTVDMYPGDVLYIPPWWFHEVYNHPSDEEEDGEFIYGMATRFLEPAGAIWYHPLQGIYKYAMDLMYGRMSTTDAQNAQLLNPNVIKVTS